MKKCYSILILSLFACSVSFAQITLDAFKEQFKNKSIAEIKTMLVDQNKELESMIKLSSLSIKITPGNVDPTVNKTTEKFSADPKDKITKTFNEKLNKLFFAQKIVHPNTLLGIDFSTSSLISSVKDYDNYEFPKPTLTLKKIYFKDGKSAELTQPVVGRDGNMDDEVKGTKWIDSVRLEASYYYPDQLSFVNLSLTKPLHNLPKGKIILVGINGNEVELQLSPSLKDEIIKVEGINASGKPVEQSGSSSSSMSSNYSAAFLNELYQASETVIAQIDKKTYKNTEELVADLYDKMPKEDKEKPENLTNASYSFNGNIKAINIFFKPQGAIYNHPFTLKNQAEYIDGFAVAQNKKGLSGILDENGKWVVEPTYERLEFYKGNYFMGDVDKDGYRSIHWLDRTSKKLIPFKYRFYGTDPYFNKYYAIENGINGPKGLVDMHTNKILIEPIHDNVYGSGNFLIITTTDEKSLILDENLKEIIVVNDYGFKVHDDYIFVNKPYNKKEKFADYTTLSNTEDIYNKEGQKINKEDYVIDTYDYFGKDGLLLVKNKAGKNIFINGKGEVALDASKYADVEKFSNGLAPVKNQAGKWGYINPTGMLIIPFMYNEAKNFSKTSALVKTETGYMLIDHKNKPIKRFAQGFSSMKVGKDAEELEYQSYDGKTYGSKGEVKTNK